MWLDNLKELKAEKNISTKVLAEKSNLPEKTVARILSGRTANPYIDTLDRLCTALGCTIGDILADTKLVVGEKNLATLQENIDAVTAERDLILAENAILKDKVTSQANEIELLKMKLLHKEELLALHNYYNKLTPNN
jgi:DNA-binding Xre family transcriptional regulator